MSTRQIKKYIKVIFSVSVAILSGALFYFVHQSKFFHVNEFDVSIFPANGRDVLIYKELEKRSYYKEKSNNIFSTRFNAIEKEILLHPWVDSIEVKKEFPSKLKLNIELKRPIAVFQTKAGNLFYLDKNAEIITTFSLKGESNLPFIYGVSLSDKVKLRSAISIIKVWESENVDQLATLSALTWSTQNGWQGSVLYNIKSGPKNLNSTTVRASLFWHERSLLSSKASMRRFLEVIAHISDQKIEVSQILFISDKKIVVRTI